LKVGAFDVLSNPTQALCAEQEDRVVQSLATAVSKLRNEKKIKEEEEEWIDSDDDWSE